MSNSKYQINDVVSFRFMSYVGSEGDSPHMVSHSTSTGVIIGKWDLGKGWRYAIAARDCDVIVCSETHAESDPEIGDYFVGHVVEVWCNLPFASISEVSMFTKRYYDGSKIILDKIRAIYSDKQKDQKARLDEIVSAIVSSRPINRSELRSIFLSISPQSPFCN